MVWTLGPWCGLWDLGKVDLRTFCGLSDFFCGLSDFFCGLKDYVIVLSLPSLFYSFYLFLTEFYCT